MTTSPVTEEQVKTSGVSGGMSRNFQLHNNNWDDPTMHSFQQWGFSPDAYETYDARRARLELAE